jgi:hypothetical protein
VEDNKRLASTVKVSKLNMSGIELLNMLYNQQIPDVVKFRKNQNTGQQYEFLTNYINNLCHENFY